ncbi:MAG: hypothetical protein DSY47_06000 [Hydrogenothermus sp.]|nr:MAG: hypothetical protein DSY47_06000 [Hydrogenothermus sp.]
MKKLPIGIQNLREIIEGNYYYVDKTKEAYELINTYKYTFLARPRRFGKSLFLDTLKEIFEGNKKLFEGLYIYDKWNWDEKFPVVKISWSGNFQTLENLEQTAIDIFKQNQKRLGITCDNTKDPNSCFRQLIENSYEKYKKPVVILVDEYDKPILDVIDNTQQAKINREFLRGLYSIIKDNDQYIRFVFLTGVSKFSRASIFSGLNMLVDISLLPQFGNICGITQQELEETFKDLLYDVDLNELKEWYNGYYFLKDKVYNPFDVIQFLSIKEYRNYWFASGNPSFLIKLLKQNKYYLPKFEDLIVDQKILDVFDIEKIDLEVLLYQAGYLTIKDVKKTPFGTQYKLYFPNKEVKISFNDVIIDYIIGENPAQFKLDLYNSLLNGDIDKFVEVFKRIFANIPYTYSQFIKGYEGFYASVVYVYLLSLGLELVAEDITNKGRIDLTVFIEDKIYIIEFKTVKENEECKALYQIKEKNYCEKYQNQDKEIYLIGICFSEKEKNVINAKWERI